jgi:outer membrane receptor protein involved in Fe transport
MTRKGFSEKTPVLLFLLFVFLLAPGGDAWAQVDASDEGEAIAVLDRIVVTGSRIKRGELEGAAPVIIIDQQQMSERGYTTVFEALSNLTINNGYKIESPEFGGFTPDVQTINLRGFGVGTTLTLINGRRLANYPAAYQSNATVFSYGAIPVAAIERIEILTTGASAIYGSDAVAGVVNIILRSNLDQTTVNALWGTPTETKSTRGDTHIQFLNGKTFDRGSYTFTGEYLNRTAIRGRHYKQYDDQQDDFPYGEGYHDRANLTLDWFEFYWFGDGYRDPAEILGVPGEQACAPLVGSPEYAFRPNRGYFCADPNGGVPESNFQHEKESISLYFNGKYEMGDRGTELWTDLLYYKAESSSFSRGIYIDEDILDLTMPSPTFPSLPDWRLAQRRFNEDELGLDMSETFDDEAWTFVLGVRGVFADRHDWEFSVNYSEYAYESTRPWFKWRETIDTFLGQWLGVGYFGDDLWTGGTLGENLGFGLGLTENMYGNVNDSVRVTLGRQFYGNKTTDLYVQYVMNGDLLEMSTGPLSYALVLEYENEDLKFIPDELIQQAPPTTDSEGNPITGLTGSGWYRLTGYQGVGDRTRYSAGGELRIPLHETFTINLAARFDTYDSGSTSFGNDVTPSASFEWRPLNGFLVRGGYSESFRAPDMAAVFVRTGFYDGGTDWINCYESYVVVNGSDGGFDTADCESEWIFAQRVGAQDIGGGALDAETGDTTWFGIAWDITNGLSLSVDYTRMSLTQRVQQQSTSGLLADEWACFNGEEPNTTPCDQVENQIVRFTDPTSGISFIDQFYVTSINQFEEDASFVDVNLMYLLNTEAGSFRFQLDYNNMLDHTSRLTPESEEQNLKSDPIFGGRDFRSSAVGSVTWAFRDFTTTVTGIYRGSTIVFNCSTSSNGCVGNVTGEDYYATENWWVDPYTTWNWTGTYNWTDAFLTRLRVVNLFDEKPVWDDTIDAFANPWYNSPVYPGAGIGRYMAIEAEYTWQ